MLEDSDYRAAAAERRVNGAAVGNAAPAVLHFLKDLAARQKAVWLFAVIIGAVAVTATGFEAVIVLDAAWRLSPAVRMAAWLATLLVAGLGGGAGAAAVFFRREPVAAWARRVEVKHSQFDCGLITCIELLETRRELTGVEKEVAGRLAEQHYDYLRRMDIEKEISQRPVWIALGWLAAAILILLVILPWTGSRFSVLLRRALQPAAAVDAPTRTRLLSLKIAGKPAVAGDTVLVVRDTLFTVQATVDGEIPDAVVFRLVSGGVEEEFSMNPLPEEPGISEVSAKESENKVRRFSVEIAGISSAAECRAAAGDDSEGPVRLLAVPPPRVKDILVTVQPPKFIGAEAEQFRNSDGWGYYGSKITVQAMINRPPARDPLSGAPCASVILSDSAGQRLPPARTTVHDTLIMANFVLQRDVRFDVCFTDRYGFENSGGISYAVRVIADAAPTVELAHISHNSELPADAEFSCNAEAYDDVGIWKVNWRLDPGGNEISGENRKPMASGTAAKPSGKTNVVSARVAFCPLELGLEPGRVVVLRVTAFDTHLPHRTGEAAPLRLKITPPMHSKADRVGGSVPDETEQASKDTEEGEGDNTAGEETRDSGAEQEKGQGAETEKESGGGTGAEGEKDEAASGKEGAGGEDSRTGGENSASGEKREGEGGSSVAEGASGGEQGGGTGEKDGESPGKSGSGGVSENENAGKSDQAGEGGRGESGSGGRTKDASSPEEGRRDETGSSGGGGGGSAEGNPVNAENPAAAAADGSPSPVEAEKLEMGDIPHELKPGQEKNREVKAAEAESLKKAGDGDRGKSLEEVVKRLRLENKANAGPAAGDGEKTAEDDAAASLEPPRRRRIEEKSVLPDEYIDDVEEYYKLIAR